MNHATDLVEMYSARTVLAASLLVTVAAIALTLALLAPTAAVVATACLLVASTVRRLYGRWEPAPRPVEVETGDISVQG